MIFQDILLSNALLGYDRPPIIHFIDLIYGRIICRLCTLYMICFLLATVCRFNATKSYLHFGHFAGEAVLYLNFFCYCFQMSYFCHKNKFTLASDLRGHNCVHFANRP